MIGCRSDVNHATWTVELVRYVASHLTLYLCSAATTDYQYQTDEVAVFISQTQEST
jgi:hypothetical protein